MTSPFTTKTKRLSKPPRPAPEKRMRSAKVDKPAALETGKHRRLLLSEIWKREQKRVLGGKIATLSLPELRPWTALFSAEELNDLVIPKRTLARRKSRHEPLNLEETDKALRLARISTEAERVFGSQEKSARWLRKPNPAFSGQTPLELLKSETGAVAVNELLGQIDHGMFV
jgi:putative toxin-antitoxin system antitoxin component (TIGR02293 family)